ncbi:MAG: Maf family protein [Treponema sp.]|nr:Maf family protein [Treponema sp.]
MSDVILASASPRRQEYFRRLGIPFTAIPPAIDETCAPDAEPAAAAEKLAVRKALKVLEDAPRSPWVCGADTLAALEGRIFGKPRSREEARAMLSRLAGKTHHVYTGLALAGTALGGALDSRVVCSRVSFGPLSPGEIEWYLDTGEWQGAAGAYRVQGLGGCLVSRLEGSYSAVAGLPVRELYLMLRKRGYPLFPREPGFTEGNIHGVS